MAFELSSPHRLDMADARARLKAMGDYLSAKYGLAITWTGEDEASISGSYLVVQIAGNLRLTPTSVSFTGKDPGMLWRGKANATGVVPNSAFFPPQGGIAAGELVKAMPTMPATATGSR